MACFGTLSTVRGQCAPSPEFAAAFAYAAEALKPGSEANRRILSLKAGENHRCELGGGVYVSEMAYQTKARSDGFFETHRKHIDVQVIVQGDELMEVAPAELLAVTQPYDAAKDFAKHADTKLGSVLRVRESDVAVFWPADAHMPSLAIAGPALVRKAVVKVPVR